MPRFTIHVDFITDSGQRRHILHDTTSGTREAFKSLVRAVTKALEAGETEVELRDQGIVSIAGFHEPPGA